MAVDKLENGKVGGGWYGEGHTGTVRVGDTATVWDGEIAGMLGAAEGFETGEQILLSKAAISAIKEAGRKEKARTGDFKRLLEVLEGMKDATVALGWVKSHIGIEGVERADEMAKVGAERSHILESRGLREQMRWRKSEQKGGLRCSKSRRGASGRKLSCGGRR